MTASHPSESPSVAGIALVTGADRGLGQGLCAGLLQRGWRVFAGQYMPDWPELGELLLRYPDRLHLVPLDVANITSVQAAAQSVAASVDHLDMLISNAGIRGGSGDIREGLDYDHAHRVYDVNSLAAIRLVQAFLPLLDRGALKRLCFVSSEAGSIAMSQRTSQFDYCLSKTALNMAVRIMHNDLYGEGYGFRLYHPGWVRSYMSGAKNPRATLEPEEAAEMALPIFLGERDEARLTLIDNTGREWPF